MQNMIIPLSDSHILGDKISLESLKEILNRQDVNIIAIDLESSALVRALQAENKAREKCFAIIGEEDDKISLCVFLNNQKIFYYQEKYITQDRLLKLFELNYPDIKIEMYYKSTQKLLEKGLSLWDEKTCKNYLAKKPKEREEVVKSFFKTILSAVIVVFLAHMIIFSWSSSQMKKINFYTHYTQSLQPIIDLKSHTELLNNIILKQNQPIKLLTTINKIMPDGVFLNALNFNNQEITLTGKAGTQAQIDNLLSALKKPVVKNITQDVSYPPYHFNFVITAGDM